MLGAIRADVQDDGNQNRIELKDVKHVLAKVFDSKTDVTRNPPEVNN